MSTASGPRRVATLITELSGGAGTMCLRGAAGLDPARYRPAIVTGGGQLLAAARRAGLHVLVEPSLRSPIDPLRDARALRNLTRLLAANRFDLVHTHCAKAGALGRVAALRTGTRPVVHTYHGFPFHRFQPAPRRLLYTEIERGLGAATDLALCVGDLVAQETVRRGLMPARRVRTIGVPVPREVPVRTPRARALARARLGVHEDRLLIGTVGRLTYQKAPEDFVTAVSLLDRPDVTGVWIGGGELSTRIRTLAASAPARIVLTGQRTDVAELLPALDVFVLPSRHEGLPLAIVEAMVCGVPVVATAVNSVPDLVQTGQTGLLVPPRAPERIAAACAYLLDNPSVAAEIAATAQERLCPEHAPRAHAAALTDAYDTVLSRPLRRPREIEPGLFP